jgi:hypothetical protein
MHVNRPVSFLLGLAILAGGTLLNQWAFTRWFGTSYPAWYLANGSLIGLISSIVALSWGDLNRHVGLISAHPLDYLGSYLQLAGLPIYELGTHLRTGAAPRDGRNFFDLLVASLVAGAISVAILVWVLVVAPAQYFLYLVCGAPGRVFAGSRVRVTARFEGGTRLELREMERGANLPEGWWEAGIANKPVALTGALAALALTIVRWVT